MKCTNAEDLEKRREKGEGERGCEEGEPASWIFGEMTRLHIASQWGDGQASVGSGCQGYRQPSTLLRETTPEVTVY